MTTYCSATDSIAIVTLTKNGKAFQVKSTKPPLTINCKSANNPDCTAVKVNYYRKDKNSNTNAISEGNYSYTLYAPILGMRILNEYDIQIHARGAVTSGICSTARWYTIASGGGNWKIVEARITDITPIETNNLPNTKGVQIIDSTGAVIFDDNAVDCNWDVKCDEECPEGSHKCTHNKFPGYCCVSCQEVGNRLKNIAAQLRG
ncbi:MAG: hypothetical protein RMZ69_23850 [Nostoc sp. ChiQUE01a]|nr:hypothetical protein [Nostoc sp. ChiQUE01a]